MRRGFRGTQLTSVVWCLLIVLGPPALAFRSPPRSDGGPVRFDRDIRPILSDNCFTCHGPDESRRQVFLRLDTQEGIFQDRGGYRPIVSGDPQKSRLYQRISAEDTARRMPPPGSDRQLTEEQIGLIRQWIEQGAPYESHWAFVPPQRPRLPDVGSSEWPKNPIDHFVLQRLEQEGLGPSAEADRRTLIRRVSLDLTGLPPTAEVVRAFLADTSGKAYEKVVDRLLASPRYGERMAIRWLDAARYADTNGYQSDGVRDMWRWRDWVIDAFNSNKTFDQFTVEQIAGDMLPDARRDQIIATAFNRNHRTSAEGGIIEEEFRTEYVADRVETTSTVWLGLTMGCARCHDHKYDPLKQREFYQFFSYFNNVAERGLVYNFGNEHPLIKAPTPPQEEKLSQLEARLKGTERAFQSLQGSIERTQSAWERWVQDSQTADWKPQRGLVLHFELDGDINQASDAPLEKPPGRPTSEMPAQPVVRGEKDEEIAGLPFVEGKLGQAASFDGKRYLEGGPGFSFNYMDPFTFSAWIYPTAPSGAIMSKVQDFPRGTGHGLYLREGKLFLYITLRWTDIRLSLQTEKRLELNRWQHVSVTYNGKRKAAYVHLYVNGEEWAKDVIFDELTYPFTSREPFRIGAGGGPKNRFQGRIDDVRVYDRALTSDEAAALSVVEKVPEIAALLPAIRSDAQKTKLRLAFLDRAAPEQAQSALAAWGKAQQEWTEFQDSLPTVMVMKEMKTPRPTYVLNHGAYDAPGEKVEPGVPAVLGRIPDQFPNNRLGLARWLVHASNPLTARVTVNRYWQMLFGSGLVTTVENFGSQGDRPIHQDLLDWLATEFTDSKWDIKHIMKTMVMSATYRQSSKVTSALLETDPENRWLARGARFRLPAEMIRDQALAVSGLLVDKIGGPSVKPYQPPGLWKELTSDKAGYVPDSGDDLYRRSLYTFWRRTVAPPSMVNFDSTDRETCTVRQVRTNTPLQALNLMNDVTYVEASRKLAERMMKEGGETVPERIAYGFELATSRLPRPGEDELLGGVYQKFLDSYRGHAQAAQELLSEGDSPRNELLDPVELASYASVASLILNLDEVVTKE